MSLPFKKSVFLELGRYPAFVDFVKESKLLDIPGDINSADFQHTTLQRYKTYLQNNIASVEKVIHSFLDTHPAFWGVVFTINKMAVEYGVGKANTPDKVNRREGFIVNKVNIIRDCLLQTRLPDYDPNLIRLHIDKGINRFHNSFDFKSRLKEKISDEQDETARNLYTYAVSIAERFLPTLKGSAIHKINLVMNDEDVLKSYFDRVVVINLDRREDRWKDIQDKFSKIKWPFKEPERFSAYDGSKLPTPVGWTHGAGTWGCMLSHREVLGRAIQDGLNNVLILEDDIFFSPDFEDRIVKFIKGVPINWDQIMLGGQFFDSSKAYDISPEVRKVSLCHRAHAYAVRGSFMRYMYSKLCASYGHVDHVMNTFQERYNIYTPQHFLIGQDGSPSDISGMKESPDLMRNPPDKDTPVFLIAPDLALHKEVFESGLPLHFGKLTADGTNEQIKKIADRPPPDAAYTIHNYLNSSIWYARSVYPSKYSTILNPNGLILDFIKQSKGNLNLIFIESMDQLREAIAKYPFGEDLPSQFPEENKTF